MLPPNDVNSHRKCTKTQTWQLLSVTVEYPKHLLLKSLIFIFSFYFKSLQVSDYDVRFIIFVLSSITNKLDSPKLSNNLMKQLSSSLSTSYNKNNKQTRRLSWRTCKCYFCPARLLLNYWANRFVQKIRRLCLIANLIFLWLKLKLWWVSEFDIPRENAVKCMLFIGVYWDRCLKVRILFYYILLYLLQNIITSGRKKNGCHLQILNFRGGGIPFQELFF
jgi:hypothetical protein